ANPLLFGRIVHATTNRPSADSVSGIATYVSAPILTNCPCPRAGSMGVSAAEAIATKKLNKTNCAGRIHLFMVDSFLCGWFGSFCPASLKADVLTPRAASPSTRLHRRHSGKARRQRRPFRRYLTPRGLSARRARQ